jgi:hypothetical protein
MTHAMYCIAKRHNNEVSDIKIYGEYPRINVLGFACSSILGIYGVVCHNTMKACLLDKASG